MTTEHGSGSAGGATRRGRWMPGYTLFLFVLAHVIVNVDKAILGVLAEPIKRELGVSDGAIAFLSGAGFTVVYALAGFPLGRWVDRGNRRNILTICLAAFSAMTGAGAFAISYVHLLVARLGVAIGEAGATPAMVSSLADIFPRGRRSTMTSIYYLGVPLGLFCTFMFGTSVAQAFGWRTAFVMVAAPGFLVALLIRFTVPEPDREKVAGIESETPPPFRDGLRAIVAQATLRNLMIAVTIAAVINAGVLLWAVSMLVRTHGFQLAEAGKAMAVALGFMGAIGTFAAGWITDRLARRDERATIWYCAAVLALSWPLALVVLLGSSKAIVVAALWFWALFNMGIFGPIVGLYQGLVISRLRGTVTATHLFITGLVGVSIGTQLVGFVSDWRAPVSGANSLRDGMLVLTMLYPVMIFFLLLAARSVRRDLASPAGAAATLT